MSARRLGFALACCFLAACLGGGGDAAADPCVAAVELGIVNGSGDAGIVGLTSAQAAAIGGLVRADGSARCTATWIHPRWVLTAAHCLEAGLRFRTRSAAGSELTIELTDGVGHPSLDLAVIALREPLPASEVAALPLALDALDVHEPGLQLDDTAVLAGAGLDQNRRHDGVRFVAEAISAIDATTITVDGRGQSGACRGDSGGPLLAWPAGTRAEVVGVLSAGSASCRGLDRYVRVDAAREWLLQAIPELAQAAAASATTQSCTGCAQCYRPRP